jgi:hypothetical protein
MDKVARTTDATVAPKSNRYKFFFFFEQRKDPKGPELHLIGGTTFYIEGLKSKQDYNKALNNYRKNPT